MSERSQRKRRGLSREGQGLSAAFENPIHLNCTVGVKCHVSLAPQWYLPYFLNGGAGATKSVGNVFFGVGYPFKHVGAIGGHRHLEWNSKAGSPVGKLTVPCSGSRGTSDPRVNLSISKRGPKP